MKFRTIGAILLGFLAFEALVLVCMFAARAGWPAYAGAEPARTYTLGMFLARLSAGSLSTFAGGAVAVRVDRGASRTPLVFGVLLLVLSVVRHITIWDQYPVWYHLGWFACIVPSAVLGGRLAARQAKMVEGGW